MLPLSWQGNAWYSMLNTPAGLTLKKVSISPQPLGQALLSGEQRGKGSRGPRPPSLNTNGYQVSDTSALRAMR